jgi:alkanesulfonate monooxygenase SsuD/methylene tetrahydromethanopterin reductase-like flavin-dependent oxidoreductase (luciferase family)
MKLGIFLSTQFPPGASLEPEIGNILSQVRAARDAGLNSVWLGQHVASGPLQMFQMMPLLARIVPEAGDMTIGSSVILLAMQNPVRVAEEMATLDWLCGGRLVMGAGIGYRKEEFEAAGVAMNTRGKRFEEALEIVRRCWRGGEVDFSGEYFRLSRQVPSLQPKQPSGPPIWVAGEVDVAVRRAARLGDAWIPLPIPNRETLASLLELFRKERAAAGLAPVTEQPLMREVYVGDNTAKAFDECVDALKYKYQAYAGWGQDESASSSASFNDDFRNFAQDRFVIGDQKAVGDELKRYRNELGIGHMICRVQWPGLSQAQVLATIERLGACARGL